MTTIANNLGRKSQTCDLGLSTGCEENQNRQVSDTRSPPRFRPSLFPQTLSPHRSSATPTRYPMGQRFNQYQLIPTIKLVLGSKTLPYCIFSRSEKVLFTVSPKVDILALKAIDPLPPLKDASGSLKVSAKSLIQASPGRRSSWLHTPNFFGLPNPLQSDRTHSLLLLVFLGPRHAS